ncbi:hypothetical protein BDW62DRAFT_194993 [Aspergillus aurantiobrunneus]
MATHPPSSAHHQSKSGPQFERFEYLPSPRTSVHGHVSDTEMGVTVQTQDPQPDTEPKRPAPKRPGFDWSDSWAWEIGSVTLAVVGLALLVAFLVTIDNTPYANWQYTASPNTVVSIIITITKAVGLVSVSSCLGQLKWNLFQNPAPLYYMEVLDQASRGPWGSLEILLRGLFGSNIESLTYIGAALTVLALAVDPFAQQILAFPSRTVPALNATASTQTSQEWYSIGGVDESNQLTGLAPKLLTSVMSGLLQTHNPLEPGCTASSCEFPEFFALGMCSTCKDVTAQTIQQCEVPEFSIFLDTGDPAFAEIPTNCSYQTPSNFSFEFEGFDNPRMLLDNVSYGMDHWSLRARQIDPYLDIQSPIFDIQTPIGAFIAISYSILVTYTPSNATIPPPKPSVSECAVYFCERKYSSSTYPAGSSNSRPMQVANTQQLIPTDALDSSAIYDSAESVHFAPPTGSATLSPNSSYSIDRNTFTRLEDTMMRLFNSTTALRGDMSRIDLSNIASILRTGNLSELLDSMSTSVTDTLRTNPHGTKIFGNSFRDETFIQVRWPWIILPVIVTLGSIALLLGTAIGSKQKKAVLWKCMVLPLLSSHLHTAPENEIASMRSVDGMTDKSKKMRAVMVQDEGPLIFKEK